MRATDFDSVCLALDLGAESGRAILGRFKSGRLSIKEIARFRNEPLSNNGRLHWDALRLRKEISAAIHSVSSHGVLQLDGVGVDTWGVDYALLRKDRKLLDNPSHYRDPRTNGVMAKALEVIGPEKIYHATGIQFLPFNTLYQLYAMRLQEPKKLDSAAYLLTMPDLFRFWLSKEIACEYTNASTTQCLDAHSRKWSSEILEKLEIPVRIFPLIIQPGTLVGKLAPEIALNDPALSRTQVIAPACHDTASAFAAVETGADTALISSGTWSLLGAELPRPVVNDKARRLNFTNEGGVEGTVRLLKNITGLWILERCRRHWQSEGVSEKLEDLLRDAAAEPALQSFIVPDDPSFALPANMPQAIAAFCAKTNQDAPRSPGAITRCILESLAMRYRQVLAWLEELAGTTYREIRIVGGGSQNDLLNQFTANATGRRVLAGPAEATAIGNLAMQLSGIGAVGSLREARIIVAECFPPRVFNPLDMDLWEKSYEKFRALTEEY